MRLLYVDVAMELALEGHMFENETEISHP